MPYIDNLERVHYRPIEHEIKNQPAATSGELNYLVTLLCDEYLNWHGLKYSHINDVIGVLECAKMEMYRRIAAPYEDQKINENGDVYKPF